MIPSTNPREIEYLAVILMSALDPNPSFVPFLGNFNCLGGLLGQGLGHGLGSGLDNF